MQEVQRPHRMAEAVAALHLQAWHDYIARSGETLEATMTQRGSELCLEVVDYELGEVRQHVHFSW